ncbi:MAG: Crp/Fnr family transcriptional regulator [Syntrophothermus sp.]
MNNGVSNENMGYLKEVAIFSSLDPEELDKVAKLVMERRYRKNMVIFMEGEPGEAVFFVKSGKVKLSKPAADGREQILTLLQPGDIFAEVVLFDEGPYPATAEAIEDSVVGMIRNKDMEELIRSSPEISLKMLKVMNKKLRHAQTLIRDLALKDTNGRLAGMLLNLAEEYGERIDDRIRLSLPLTRQEIANLIGTSRETVTRLLSEFQKARVLEINRQEIVILDERKLRSWS